MQDARPRAVIARLTRCMALPPFLELIAGGETLGNPVKILNLIFFERGGESAPVPPFEEIKPPAFQRNAGGITKQKSRVRLRVLRPERFRQRQLFGLVKGHPENLVSTA